MKTTYRAARDAYISLLQGEHNAIRACPDYQAALCACRELVFRMEQVLDPLTTIEAIQNKYEQDAQDNFLARE